MHHPVNQALNQGDRQFARRDERDQAHQRPRPVRRSGRMRGDHSPRHGERGDHSDRAEIERGGVGQNQPLDPLRCGREVCHVGLELASPRSDQVVSDVRGARLDAESLGLLPRALDRAQRDAHLRLTGRVGERLDRVPISVAALEVHPGIHAGGVAAEDLLDQAHVLDVLVPVHGRAQPETRDRVAHRQVIHRLTLVLGANRFLDGRAGRVQPVLELSAKRGGTGAVFAHALEQLIHERDMQDGWEREHAAALPFALEGGEVPIRVQPAGATLDQFLREPVQVLDQRQLEHARPGPEFADAERRNRLIGVNKAIEPVRIEPGIAVAEQFDGHRIHASSAGQFARCEFRQLAVIATRKVMADLAHLAFHQMEVVEQPFGCRRDRLAAPHVSGKDAIGIAEHARVIGQATQQAGRAAARVPRQREFSRERAGPFLEALDAQQLAVQWARVEPDQPEASAVGHSCRGRSGAGAWQLPAVLSMCNAGRPRPLSGRSRQCSSIRLNRRLAAHPS